MPKFTHGLNKKRIMISRLVLNLGCITSRKNAFWKTHGPIDYVNQNRIIFDNITSKYQMNIFHDYLSCQKEVL